MNDRLVIAYGLMFLMAVLLAAVVWWNVHHSHHRTYKRRQARGRKGAMAAEQAKRHALVDRRDLP